MVFLFILNTDTHLLTYKHHTLILFHLHVTALPKDYKVHKKEKY